MSESSVWDRNYTSGITSAWTNHPLVARHVYDTISDGAGLFWLNWVFEGLLRRQFKRVLSIGCGDGAHELLIARAGYATQIDAFDASTVGIRRANETARAENLNCRFSVDTFEAFEERPCADRYDFVLFSGSLHHIRNLEGMLSKVHAILAEGGVVCVNEYIGARHGLYPQKQINLANNVLAALAPAFRASKHAAVRAPELQDVRNHDPSEGIRSNLIPAFLDIFFTPIYERRYGGYLLHPLFDALNSQKLKDGSEESQTIVRILIEMDKAIASHPDYGSDFLFGVYRSKEVL